MDRTGLAAIHCCHCLSVIIATIPNSGRQPNISTEEGVGRPTDLVSGTVDAMAALVSGGDSDRVLVPVGGQARGPARASGRGVFTREALRQDPGPCCCL